VWSHLVVFEIEVGERGGVRGQLDRRLVKQAELVDCGLDDAHDESVLLRAGRMVAIVRDAGCLAGRLEQVGEPAALSVWMARTTNGKASSAWARNASVAFENPVLAALGTVTLVARSIASKWLVALLGPHQAQVLGVHLHERAGLARGQVATSALVHVAALGCSAAPAQGRRLDPAVA
jgi:hypothetical protein